jgi:hypothetical protein
MSQTRQTGGILLGFAALGTLLIALQPKPMTHPNPATSGKRDEEKKASLDSGSTDSLVREGPAKPIWDFLALAPTTAETRTKRYAVELTNRGALVVEEPSGHDAGARLYDWPPRVALENCTFRFLIATVPDPLDSGFAHEFDQVVEALQRALEADDYVIDRAWIPWRRAQSGQKVTSRLHERHPGLVLFRTDKPQEGDSRQRLLALLLVGESPTAGIHKIAFHNAVRLIHSCPGFTVEGPRIRVLGPYFSGSAVSLRLALRQTRKSMELLARKKQLPEPWIKVVCGSASGFSHHEFVKPYKDKDGGWRGEAKEEKEPAFATTILPNALLLHWVRKYLGNPADPVQGESPVPIVVLHEANTSFGRHSVRSDQHVKSSSSRPELFQVPFPLHISQLRASYTREQLARAESLGLPHTGRNLPFPSDDQGKDVTGREAIAVRDPLLSAAIDDLILDNLVTTMAQKQARYTCLISTDVRDTIFLARVIRDRHPDVQLVTLENDLLLTHEDYNSALRGMIVASTYPLYPAFQRWSDLAKDQRQAAPILFAKQSYQGTYNAALVQLMRMGQVDKLLPRMDKLLPRMDKLLPRMKDYGWEGPPADVTLPPIWISVVGSNGQMIPVTYIAPAHYTCNLPSDEDDPDPLQYVFRRPRLASPPAEMKYGRLTPPNMWFFAFALLLVVNSYFFYQFNRYLHHSGWDETVAGSAARYKQRADFAVGCLALVLLYGRIAELAWTPLRANPFGSNRSPAIAVGLVWLLSVAMVGLAWLALLAAHWREYSGVELSRRKAAYGAMIRGSEPMYAWLAPLGWVGRGGLWIVVADLFMLLLVTFAVIGFTWRNLVAAFGAFPPQKVVFFERLIHLTNGVSPLLPRLFFCTALFAWSFFLVKKLHLANHNSIRCPFPRKQSAHFKGLRALHRDLHKELMPPSTLQRHFGWCLLMFILVLIVFGKLAYDAPWPMEGPLFGRFALFGFFAGSFLLLFTLLQFYFAWHSLRKLLRFVALLPMQSAFERLSDKVVAIFGHYLHALRPQHSHLSIIVQQYHRLHRLFPTFFARLQNAVGNLQLGQLDGATLNAAWHSVERTFHRQELDPPVAKKFEKEVDPVKEQELEPPARPRAVERGGDTAARGAIYLLHPRALKWGGVTGEDIHGLALRCLRVLYSFWSVHSMDEAFGRAQQTTEPAGHPAPPPVYLSLPEGDALREWIIAAEDFVAVEIIRYLSQFIIQLRNLLTCLTLGSLLLVLSATVYPFPAQHLLLLFLTVLAGGIAVFILSFLIQLNRDELISRITRSTPNRFTPDLTFLHGTAAYILPILAGLMVQFPFVTATLRNLLDPLFHIIK